MVLQHEGEYASQRAVITSVASKLGMTPETLRTPVRQAETDGGLRMFGSINKSVPRQPLFWVPWKSSMLIKKVYTRIYRNQFRNLDSSIGYNVKITNPQYISIGSGVWLGSYTWIYAIDYGPAFTIGTIPDIVINDGCYIGRFSHITCSNSVILERNVMVNEGVLISDTSHGYESPDVPVISQQLVTRGPVTVGEGIWVGNGARIIGKLRIGRNCVIGTNAVVLRDVPDYCVVAGAPARIVKRYSLETQKWVHVDEAL